MRHKATEYIKYNASKRIHYDLYFYSISKEASFDQNTLVYSYRTTKRCTHTNGYHHNAAMNTSTSLPPSAFLLPLCYQPIE